jgi:hypothetical protein
LNAIKSKVRSSSPTDILVETRLVNQAGGAVVRAVTIISAISRFFSVAANIKAFQVASPHQQASQLSWAANSSSVAG